MMTIEYRNQTANCNFSLVLRFYFEPNLSRMRVSPIIFFFFSSISLFAQSNSTTTEMELQVSEAEVFFESGKSDLPSDVDSLLNNLVQVLQKDPFLKVRVRAHTDAIGSISYNIQLSEDRATAVRRQLFSMGVDSSQVVAKGFGEGEPQATNNTAEGRQANRRATVEVFQPVKMLPLRGVIVDAETQKPLMALIIIRGRYFIDSLQTDSLGQYETMVPAQSNLVMETFSEGYIFETTMLRVKHAPIEVPKVELPKIKPGIAFDLKNFYFVGNQAVLLERSKPELNRLLKFMQYNPHVRIEIAGHVNVPNNPPVTKVSWEFGLSERRAKMVFDFLDEQGIDRNRMEYNGYGNWHMKFPRATTAKQQEMNRRVEIKILEETEAGE